MQQTRRVSLLAVALALLLSPAPAFAAKYLPVKGYTASTGASDRIYVVATAHTPDGGFAALAVRDSGSGDVHSVFKVNAAGQLVWEADVKQAMTGGGAMVTANDLAVHSSGRVFITGGVSGSGSTSLFVAEFSAAGAYAGASFVYDSSGGEGWTLAIYGDILYVGGELGGIGHLGRINISGAMAVAWNTTAGLTAPVLGIARVGSDVFASYRESSFGNSNGWMNKYTDNTTFAGPVVWTVTGGGRAHVSPDGLVYVAARRVTRETVNFTGNAFISVVNPATGAVTSQDVGLPLQAPNSNSGDCCSYMSGIVDFGFLADGTMVVAWLGSEGVSNSATSGLAGYGRSVVDCSGSGGSCRNWQFLWQQPTFSPYISAGNAEVRSLAVSGALVVLGVNTITCVDEEGGCGNRYGIVILDNALEQNAPAKGTMQIRRNVMRVDRGDEAVVVLAGEPYANVVLAVYGPSGNIVTALRGSDCMQAAGEICEIQLDFEGRAAVTFDGKYNDLTPLRSGLYWIVASGGISDRKPVIVRSK